MGKTLWTAVVIVVVVALGGGVYWWSNNPQTDPIIQANGSEIAASGV
jgi:uncharacterized membrane protein YqiK